MFPIPRNNFNTQDHHAFVLARFARDEALVAIENYVFEATSRGGVPSEVLHCSLLYARGLVHAEPFRRELARYTATLGAFEVRTDKLLSVNVGSLWLSLEKDDALIRVCSDLAALAQRCGLGNRGFALDNWVPHILLARFPGTVGLPIGTCVNLKLRVNQFDLTRQIGADEFENLGQFLLKAER